MKPVIAILCAMEDDNFKMNKHYVDSVKKAGGYPLLVPIFDPITDASHIANMFSIAHGFVFAGGIDVESKKYGEEPHEKAGKPMKERDDFEIAACKMALAMDKPLLCICRGSQILNITLGGTLVQHIDGHNVEDKPCEYVHTVKLVENTLLYDIINKYEIKVNSLHHQAVSKLGVGLVEAAHAEDGTVEAIYLPGKKFVLGTQWHPEKLSEISEENLNIFKKFIKSI